MPTFEGRYFVSMIAARFDKNTLTNHINHHLCIYDRFNNEDEVLGRATKWIEGQYPANDGWRHDISVMSHDAPNPALAKPSHPEPPHADADEPR